MKSCTSIEFIAEGATICTFRTTTRRTLPNKSYEYVVEENKCIGCGFCAGVCPCGVWNMVENV